METNNESQYPNYSYFGIGIETMVKTNNIKKITEELEMYFTKNINEKQKEEYKNSEGIVVSKLYSINSDSYLKVSIPRTILIGLNDNEIQMKVREIVANGDRE
jgi:hypothetical protein